MDKRKLDAADCAVRATVPLMQADIGSLSLLQKNSHLRCMGEVSKYLSIWP
jgi:hypothetical protein